MFSMCGDSSRDIQVRVHRMKYFLPDYSIRDRWSSAKFVNSFRSWLNVN